jgi:DNA-binding IclR family transcriptional regulator
VRLVGRYSRLVPSSQGCPSLFVSALTPRLGRSLQAFTAKTIVDVDRVEEELTQTLKRGYAAAPEEAMLGIRTS